MATLTEFVRKRRESGQGVISSLAGSAQDKLKEKLNWRRMFNQDGLMTALFPQLRIEKNNQIQESNAELISSVALELSSELSIIETNTEIAAKNSMVLPLLARDMNVMRQNFSKFVRLMGGDTTSEADEFFKTSRQRETEYESAIAARGLTKRVDEEKPEDEKGLVKSFLSSIGGFFGTLISSITGAIKFVFSSIFGTLKFLLSTVIGKILGIVSGVLLSIVGVVTDAIVKLLTKFSAIFTKIGLNMAGILTKVLLSGPGLSILAGAALVAAAIRDKKIKEHLDVLRDKQRELLEKERLGTITSDERTELATTTAILESSIDPYNPMARQVGFDPMAQFLSQPRAEEYLENLRSSDPEVRERTKSELRENFNIASDHESILETYLQNRFRRSDETQKQFEERQLENRTLTLRDAQRRFIMEQSSSSDEFFSDINAPTLTSPEPQVAIASGIRMFDVNQASVGIRDEVSRRRSADGSVNTITVPENNRSSEGEPTQNLPELSDVFNIEFVRLMMSNQQPIIFK